MKIDPVTIWELSKRKTGLPVNLCLVDNHSIKEFDKHSLIMQNYYNDSVLGEFVYISIDKKTPQLLVDAKLNISKSDFTKIKSFIKKYYNDFYEYITDSIDIDELKRRIYRV